MRFGGAVRRRRRTHPEVTGELRGESAPCRLECALMPRAIQRLGLVIAGLLCCHPLFAQDGASVLVSPAVATLKVGESRSFRVTDKNGHRLQGVQWTASEPAVLDLTRRGRSRSNRKAIREMHPDRARRTGFWRGPGGSGGWSHHEAGNDSVERAGPTRMPVDPDRTSDADGGLGPTFTRRALAPTALTSPPSPPMACCSGAGSSALKRTLRPHFKRRLWRPPAPPPLHPPFL